MEPSAPGNGDAALPAVAAKKKIARKSRAANERGAARLSLTAGPVGASRDRVPGEMSQALDREMAVPRSENGRVNGFCSRPMASKLYIRSPDFIRCSTDIGMTSGCCRPSRSRGSRRGRYLPRSDRLRRARSSSGDPSPTASRRPPVLHVRPQMESSMASAAPLNFRFAAVSQVGVHRISTTGLSASPG